MSVAKAFIFSSVSQYFSSLLMIVSAAIFARLLTPSELGVFAIASSVALIAAEFKLLGTSKFLIRETSIDEEKVKSGIGITMIACWGVGFVILVLSIPIARIYEIDDVAGILQIGAINFFMAPFISVTSAVLARGLEYQSIMSIRMYSQMFGFSVSLLLVQYGFSYWSLAWGNVAASAIELLLFYVKRPSVVVWLPGFKYIKSIAQLGFYSSLTGILTRIGENATDLVIGKLGSTSDVAIISRANGLHSFVRQAVVLGFEPVSLPHLTKVLREGGDVKKAYIRSTSLIGVIFWPILLVTGYYSKVAILLLFGDQWLDAIPLAMILTLRFLFRSIHMFSTSILVSSFNEKPMLIRQVVVFLCTFLAVFYSYSMGLKAVAWALVGVGLIDLVLNVYCLRLAINLGILEFFSGIFKSAAVSVLCLSGAYLLDVCFGVQAMSPIKAFGVLALTMPVCWVASLFLIKHELKGLGLKAIFSR